MGYHNFWAMFWVQKVPASHIELYHLISERKANGYRIKP